MDNNLPSDRGFGVFIASIIAFGSAYCWYKGLDELFFGLMLLFAVVVVSVAVYPIVLRPINKVWYKLGLGLGKIFNPVILALIFYCVFVPFGLLGKIWGRDQLSVKVHNGSKWKSFENVQKTRSDFTKQF